MLRFVAVAWVGLGLVLRSEADSGSDWIRAAGNAVEESARLDRLHELAARPELEASVRRDLGPIIKVAEAWVQGRERAAADLARGRGETHRYLHRFFEDATDSFSPPFPRPPAATSPVYPLWALYRGRFLAWYMIEDSSVSAVPARKKLFVTEAERCFDLARQAFPENPLLRIYTGENLPAPDLSPWEPKAPEWANHQRRTLEQLHRIIRWWIQERQLPNGEFGGKWGDDVEMWRWWAPVLIGFDDPVVNAAQERLVRGNLSRPGLAAGYTSQLTDVEHTAEETADTLTPMLHVAPEDPEWGRRSRRLLELAEKVWWGQNERGQRQFQHIDFNATRLGRDSGRAYDTAYHTRVLQPLFLLWQRTGDPALTAALRPWLDTWVEAALSTEGGKPAGIVPSAIRWPSGRIGSQERGWIGPMLRGDSMMDLYSWPGYPVTTMIAYLVQAHVQTGDPRFLEPLVRMAELRRSYRSVENDGPVGSEVWAARRLPGMINEALAKWRQLSGETRFDDLLKADAEGYPRFALDGDIGSLSASLAEVARTLSLNWPMFTSEVRYTDRVLSFPRAWPRTQASGLKRADSDVVYSSVTGDPGSIVNYPLNGARWHTLPTEMAALVTQNQRAQFAAELFHFGAAPRSLAVSLLVLEPGRYAWRLSDAEEGDIAKGEIEITSSARRLSLELPSRQLCRLWVKKKE